MLALFLFSFAAPCSAYKCYYNSLACSQPDPYGSWFNRSELVITLPLVVYVDDCAMIGPAQRELDAEMADLQHWCGGVVGVDLVQQV